jgi:tRNA (guanine26-N2/guanine27-N2)-dimethyltransferase
MVEIFDIGFPTEVIKEGEVRILVPKLAAFVSSPSDYAPSKAPVFYNPIMELNRDIAVLALQAYHKILKRDLFVCEPLTGCGIRGIRFAKEIVGVKKVVINDINEKAVQLAEYNVKTTGLKEKIIVKNEEANLLLSNYAAPRKRFDAIDIDPFGSPIPFLDSALRALRSSGLLALTATDLASLCGIYPKACIRKYGGKPLRTEYCHELAVRLLAGCLAVTAAKHDIGVKIVFCHSTDHYIRVYATTEYGAKKADQSLKNMGYIKHCFKCFHRDTVNNFFLFDTSTKCRECGAKMDFSGPLWIGKLFDKTLCLTMKDELEKRSFRFKKRIEKLLELISKEAEAPVTHYTVDMMCDAINLPVPPIKKVLSVLKRNGYQAFLTHFNSKGIKSNVSAMKMCEILRRLSRLN